MEINKHDTYLVGICRYSRFRSPASFDDVLSQLAGQVILEVERVVLIVSGAETHH